MRVGEICKTNIVFCEPQTSIVDAAKLMREHHVGDVIVATDDAEGVHAQGIITDRDLVVEVLALDAPLETLTVKDVMSRSLVLIDESKGVYETLALMRHRGIRRLPVISARDNLVGIVTLDDLIETIAEELGVAAKLIAHERESKKASRPTITAVPR